MAVISSTMIGLLNTRIQNEEMSARLYLAMSLWLDINGYSGASKLWQKYSNEELTHAGWARQFMLDLNISPETPSLKAPQSEFRSLPNIIALSMKHELDITNQCQKLAQTAVADGEMMVFDLAQRYVKEQVEEIAKMQYWVDRLEAFGDSKEALFLLDNEMATK